MTKSGEECVNHRIQDTKKPDSDTEKGLSYGQKVAKLDEGRAWLAPRYVVPTGRIVVPTSRYIVPAGRVVVPTGMYIVPAGDYISYSPSLIGSKDLSRVGFNKWSDNESDDASVHTEATNTLQQPNIQPQIIIAVSNNNAKFPYLKKDDLKRTRRDHDGRVIILPPTTADEHIALQRESKARTTLLQSISDDHVADFHYMDDARDIWNAVKARMQKILSQLNQLKAKSEDEDINLKFLRALPSSWSQTLEVDVKGYTTFSSSQSAGPSHSAFISTTSASKKMSYGDSPSYSLTTTYTTPSNSKTGSHRSGNVIKDVLQSFVANTEPEQQLAYEDFEQIEKLDLEEMDLKWQMAMLSVRVQKFEQKARRKINFDKKESARFNKKKVRCYKCQQRGHFARECRAKGGNDKHRYSSFKIKEIGKKEEDSKALITVDTLVDWTDHDEETSTTGDAGEFALMGVTFEKISSKNLFRLIDSSMSVRTKVGLGFNNYIRKNKLGWDDSAFSVFTINSEDVKGRTLFNRLAKSDSMKAVPPPLSGNYTSLSDHIDLDKSQISHGTKSSTSSDSKSVSNDFVSCDDSDKSSEVNTNNCAFSDSSVKSLGPKLNDSTSCASTSSVSTSENEAEIESNIRTPIQEPIIVQDLPSFSCNCSDKNENTSRTSCNKNGYFNKKAGPFRKNASSVSKTGKVNIPPARPQPVPTGKPKVFAPIPTGRQNRPFLVPTDRGYSPSVVSGWWKSTARPLPHFSRLTSSYFHTYTPYVPTMYYNHMIYGGDKWATVVKPSVGCSWKSHRKGLYWENPFPDAEDEGVFDSGCLICA
nr:ribonuclease H-like domain-containing protein [Tanacetum cinerariifolium]